MTRPLTGATLPALLLGLALLVAPRLSAQSNGSYVVNAEWARLPAGTTWNGNTSWIYVSGASCMNVMKITRRQ